MTRYASTVTDIVTSGEKMTTAPARLLTAGDRLRGGQRSSCVCASTRMLVQISMSAPATLRPEGQQTGRRGVAKVTDTLQNVAPAPTDSDVNSRSIAS